MLKCPGQDTRYWKPDDVFDVPCPACGIQVEFFRTDTMRQCSNCHYRFRNPRLALGCAQWCPHAALCWGGHTPQPGSWPKPRPGMRERHIK